MKRYDREAIEPNAAFFKALGHPTRLWIVEQLADGYERQDHSGGLKVEFHHVL